ncbi:cellulase family glycosylhydrolase [Priestia aryabhattai]|uniref:cellulase family glycosylhydrolase n=1 Tax=Priestia aryabhattai TaxID=412384 RepID=UPI0025A39735|nr:cellulase family glycosylhydrolase [Priestia aryabhattai]WJN45974.1 cellulase family glycosylhydrolase [Priestia aryabhattai]
MIKIKKVILFIVIVIVVFGIIYFFSQKYRSNQTIVSNEIPNNIGVQTHSRNGYTDVKAIRENGFKIVRDDILWSRVEKEKNKYDFKSNGYDSYNKQLKENKVRPYYILSLSNKLYEKNNSVVTNEGRMAYTKFVGKTAYRYRGQNTLWEIWNEPNIDGFWSPAFTSVENYTRLVKAASSAIRKNDPSGIIVAPALAGVEDISLYWLEETFKRGLLEHVDAISVHPYRRTSPETVISDYEKVRNLISKYSEREIPIISGEWGYSTAPAFYGIQLNQLQQCQYLVRMMLVNISQDIPISIWYDWKNDGEDRQSGEQNFGIREFDSSIPKQASIGVSTLTKTLSGYHFSKRIEINSKKDFLLEFISDDNDKGKIYVYWTQEVEHNFYFPNYIKGTARKVSMLGEVTSDFAVNNLPLKISGSPTYIILKVDK